MTVTRSDAIEQLMALARDSEQRAFASHALEFLTANTELRGPQQSVWGIGDERLTLFHETSDEEERAEAAAALGWQKRRWEAGFGWISGPVEHGGRGLSSEFDRLYRQIESAFEIPDMSPLRIGIGTVGPVVTAVGTPEQISKYVVPIYRGESVACQLFSEPAAGSDLAGVRTRAVRDGDDWRLNGQKVWTSNAQFADIGLALVRTDPDAPKHRGITMFLVPMTAPGIDVRPLRQITGGASFTEVFLDDVVVSDRLRVGEVGGGWRVTTQALAGERKAVGDRTHEITDRAIAMLAELATRSGRFDDPQVRQDFARIYSRLRIARFQQHRIQQIPDDRLSGAERAIDKLLVSTNLRLLGELAAEILGPRFVVNTGEWGTFNWNKWLMGALGYRIAGGTEEILKTMLAERVLMLPKEPK
ncbi:acyl-CoA dehydrogenase family protein [[Mycobacterium] wendilense]|uniref:Acyl-CoA dehydrogenase family protein n=1 Tax=[Mycobacterium] wendilense TaxID=3064284 RepID=A0ABN9P5I8_9MYCO|nr:acyl-CoA dehydrogenase family protein [Mycolicibacterium sp. MU0050]CAJ1586025.1 acyl-CoA dehydrogenase family protein [Mycolicibacterium sp. MU0050]